MPFAERITVAELMQTLAMQKAIAAEAMSATEVLATENVIVEAEDANDETGANNITSLGLNKTPRKGPAT